jgi:hypothetical protein
MRRGRSPPASSTAESQKTAGVLLAAPGESRTQQHEQTAGRAVDVLAPSIGLTHLAIVARQSSAASVST